MDSNEYADDTTVTLTGYDASNNVVDTGSADQPFGTPITSTLTIDSSGGNSIKYLTIATDDTFNAGVEFSGLVWAAPNDQPAVRGSQNGIAGLPRP